MHFTFCPHCGTKLIGKEIGDEGVIPYCESCNVPLWDMFKFNDALAKLREGSIGWQLVKTVIGS